MYRIRRLLVFKQQNAVYGENGLVRARALARSLARDIRSKNRW